jgi:hypothetical protein
MIYASDPDAAPDAEFVPGELSDLVAGNRGRLLDARRTPVTIVAVTPQKGSFELEIGGFEDAGSHWELPLHDVRRLQFARDRAVVPAAAISELERAVVRFDRALAIDCDPEARQQTLRRIAGERDAIRARLEGERVDLDQRIAACQGDPRLFALLEEILAAHGLAELDAQFSAVLVSNPGSGELVKGHSIVLAELGLCPYRGKVIRDPDLFAGMWSKPQRAAHLITRIAFSQELFSQLGHDSVTLYRGAAVEGPMPERSPSSFLSATFSDQVASAHFEGGPRSTTAVLWRQLVPITRLVMTFLETRAMNLRYREAEAVLVADPDNRAF